MPWYKMRSSDISPALHERLWEMFTTTYKPLGIKHRNITELLAEYGCALLVFTDTDGEPRAVIMFETKLPLANKVTALFADGTAWGKNVMLSKLAALLVTPGVGHRTERRTG